MDPVSLENALEKKCQNRIWLLWIFFLASSPGIFNAMHITSYVFLGGDPGFSCQVPELQETNWTDEQIRIISTPSMDTHSCGMYAWNYTQLKKMNFEDAVIYVNKSKLPEIVKCKNYMYDEEIPHQTIVSEWNLVCDNLPLRSTAQVAVALGKFCGAFVFGLLADRFGRKKIFVLSCILYIAASPAGAFVKDYFIFIILRILIGVAGSGVYEAGFTTLSELTVKQYRAYLGCLYNLSYSLGFILLPVAAYFSNNWRQLQLAISIPTIIFILHCWYLPESPRWLVTRGKLEKAATIVGSELSSTTNNRVQNLEQVLKAQSHPCYKKFIIIFKSYIMLFSTFELTKRILVCYFGWFVAHLCYYAIALNGANFTVNQYYYVALNGIVEVPSYILPIIILTYFGRKSTGVALFFIAGIALLSIMIMPTGWLTVCMAMIGRLTVSAVFAVIILHTTELFPTEHRNSAVGSSLTIGQFGSMASPYLVDILGKKAWWIPSTLCGSLTIVGAFLLMFLPETKDTPMTDTIAEMEQQTKLSKISQPDN